MFHPVFGFIFHQALLEGLRVLPALLGLPYLVCYRTSFEPCLFFFVGHGVSRLRVDTSSWHPSGRSYGPCTGSRSQ